MKRLQDYDKIILSISGGKDSQAMADVIVGEAINVGVKDRLLFAYADTGAEWPESRIQCEKISKHYGVPLQIAKAFMPLPEKIASRGKFPCSSCRYCTSDCKRGALDKVARQFNGKILKVTGERREESRQRSILEEIEPFSRLTTRKREVTSYRPMLGFTEADIWRIIRASGLDYHPAYHFGNSRVSCALCVLGSHDDLRIGAERNPELAQKYLQIEKQSGHKFNTHKTLENILKGTIQYELPLIKYL